jgi:molybdate transport system regulatory protein
MPRRKTQTATRLRLQLKYCVAIGPGKATLLEQIAQKGSISSAGREIGMSYKRAWLLVNGMNSHFRSPLVAAAKGGKHGGGAVLTLLGREVLQQYRCMEQKALRAITSDITRFEKLLARK